MQCFRTYGALRGSETDRGGLVGTRCERGELRCAYGDGLPDWVRLRNGEVCYGPNLGYGRFGAKVTMDCKL